jgi:hypothetical protein
LAFYGITRAGGAAIARAAREQEKGGAAMKRGVVRTRDVVRMLEALGARRTYHGGEVKMKLQGTTIRVGRNDFSRPMLQRMERKLRQAGWSSTSRLITT